MFVLVSKHINAFDNPTDKLKQAEAIHHYFVLKKIYEQQGWDLIKILRCNIFNVIFKPQTKK